MSAQEKKRLINAVKIWCTHCGFEEIENRSYTADIVFKNGEESVGFVVLDEPTGSLFPVKTGCDLTYAVINSPENCSATQKKIPTEWGILCYGNPFGLGCLYQVLREAK